MWDPKNGRPRPPLHSPPHLHTPTPPNCWNLTVFSVRLLGFCLFLGIFAAFFCCLKQWCELMSRTKLDVKKARSKEVLRKNTRKTEKKKRRVDREKGFEYREKKNYDKVVILSY